MKTRKIRWTCFLIFISFYSCEQNDQGKIIEVFQPESKFSKPVNAKLYTHGYYQSSVFATGGYSEFQSLYLNSDTSFTFYDNSGSVSLGKWRGANDTVVLTFASRRNDIISFNLKLSKTRTWPFVTFIICDKTNHPIPNFLIQPFNDHPIYGYDSSGELVTGTQNDNKLSGFPEKYTTDSTGTLILEKKQYDSLDFTKLSYSARKKFTISTHNLPDTIKLTININATALSGQRGYLISTYAMPPPPMRLFLRGSRFTIPFD